MARWVRLTGAAAGLCLAGLAGAVPTSAQQLPDLGAASVPAGSQMLLQADTLVYDYDAKTVTAVGGVRIDYGGNRLVAQRVTYDRATSRLIASGDVQIIENDGTTIYSENIDITDDFANGFVNALRVETVDKTYFAAESAERENGLVTTFNNGVYTACKPCEDKPNRAPIWRLKARKIIWNGKTKTVRFERSRFEFFGFPIAQLPVFEIADPTVKRKSGFLMPGITYKTSLGVGVTIPYYLALSPTYDMTVKGTWYSKQGFLGEAEWRQKFDNGEYTLKVAGIRQQDPFGFTSLYGINSGTQLDPNRLRGMFGTKGHFDLNTRWQFGWDILAQTDKNFSYTYAINGFRDYVHRSEVYLTGLNDRNYFDLRGMKFQVQEDLLDTSPSATDKKQPWVLPSLDYAYIPELSVAGGELDLNVNMRSIRRDTLDNTTIDNTGTVRPGVVRGVDGNSTRLTAEAEWKRSFITEGGVVVTPLLAFQADTTNVNASQSSIDAINTLAASTGSPTDIRSAYSRMMATAGLELRWPLLFSLANSSHVLEPMAQLFARPNTPYGSTLGIPNEDAQSFVFDASTLFERDKFSGYDRIEGGTRANIGLRYTGSFDNGWTTSALFGQSYQLAGKNPFAQPDFVNVGAYSGLETNTSDYVGMAGFTTPFGLSASTGGRFDEQTFEVRRAEVKAGYSSAPFSLTGNYTFIQAQPLYGFTSDRQEVTAGTSIRFAQNWRAFGSGTYDFESRVLASDSVGFAYDDECFSYTMTMTTTRDLRKIESDEHTFGFNISFRTLGDFGSSSLGTTQ